MATLRAQQTLCLGALLCREKKNSAVKGGERERGDGVELSISNELGLKNHCLNKPSRTAKALLSGGEERNSCWDASEGLPAGQVEVRLSAFYVLLFHRMNSFEKLTNPFLFAFHD